MGPYIVGDNGPKADSTSGDSLKTDQSRLTYSFDHNGDHFLLIDTDPVGRDWRVPYHWIRADVDSARNRGTRHLFAIGHKPAYPGPAAPTDGLALYPANRDSFWSVLETGRCEAMIASHVHSWQKSQPHAGKTWQIVAGNGGSQWDSIWVEYQKPAAPYQGWTLVKVKGASVKVESWGHDVSNADYWQAVPGNPTALKDSADITWGSVPVGIRHRLSEASTFGVARTGDLLLLVWNGDAATSPSADLLDAAGRSLRKVGFERGRALVDLSSLVPGSYLLSLRTADLRESHAVVVR